MAAPTTDDVILNRMKVYRDETALLLEYYRDQLKTVDAVGTMDEVRPCVAGSGKVVMRPLARLRGRRVVPQRSAGELDAMAAAARRCSPRCGRSVRQRPPAHPA